MVLGNRGLCHQEAWIFSKPATVINRGQNILFDLMQFTLMTVAMVPRNRGHMAMAPRNNGWWQPWLMTTNK